MEVLGIKSVPLRKLMIGLGGLAVLVVLFLLLNEIFCFVFVRFLYGSFISDPLSRAGLNPYMVRAASTLVIPVFVWFMRQKSWILRWRGMRTKLISIATVVFLYNVSFYFITRHHNFGPDGKPIRFFVYGPTKVEYSYQPGIDPVTGQKWAPLTPEILPSLLTYDRVGGLRRVDLDDSTVFIARNGWPMTWYIFNEQGGYELWNGPGFDPQGRELKPVTREVVSAIQAWRQKSSRDQLIEEDQKESKERQREADADREAARSHAEEEATAQKEEYKSLFNPSNAAFSGSPKIALAVLDDSYNGDLATKLEAVLPKNLFSESDKTGTAPSVSGEFFTTFFRSKGYLGRAMEGDLSSLKEGGALQLIDGVLLAKAKADYSSNEVVEGMVSCHLSFSYKLFDAQSRPVDGGNIEVTGPGFNNASALDRSIELLGGKLTKLLLQKLSKVANTPKPITP